MGPRPIRQLILTGTWTGEVGSPREVWRPLLLAGCLFAELGYPQVWAKAHGRGLLVCALDGTVVAAADSAANLGVYRKQRGGPTGGGQLSTLRLLAVLYHERWEIETAYLELKPTVLGSRVLRARTPDGIEQEACALPVTYQALRAAIADAASTVPGTDPFYGKAESRPGS